MAAIQQTRWDKLLRRVASIVGEGAIVTETLQEVFPVFDLEDPPAELLILGGTRICFGAGVLGAVSGQASRFQLFNPDDSGYILICTKVLFSPSSNGIVRYGVVNQAIASVGTQRFADTRGRFTALPLGSINQTSSVALAPATGQYRQLGGTTLVLNEPKGLFVLGPGTGIEFGSANLNTVNSCTFHWRERPALSSELDL